MQTTAEQRAFVLEMANRIAADILTSHTGYEALQEIAEAARSLAKARYAALGVARADGQGLKEFVTAGLTQEEVAAIGPRPTGKGILGLLLHRAEPLRIDAIAAHSASVGFPPGHPPMTSFLGVPIRKGEVAFGSLYLTDKAGGEPFTEADEAAVQALGAHAAIAIHNLELLSRQRALVSGLIAAQEEERRAVAYDLHDGLTQYVMAAHAHLESFRRAQEEDKRERAARELDQGMRYLREAVVEARRLVNGLRSLALDDMGLAGAVEQLLTEEKARAGWEEAEILHNIAGERFDKSLETAAYRVIQEALTNVRKHAAASRVRVLLLREQEAQTKAMQLRLEVRDWGQGFVMEEKAEESGHVGLHSMSERARLLNGTLTIRSAPKMGTTVFGLFPVLEPTRETQEGQTA